MSERSAEDQLQTTRKVNKQLVVKLKEADTEIQRLQAALEDYGGHSGACGLDYGDECTCGFRKALEEGKK